MTTKNLSALLHKELGPVTFGMFLRSARISLDLSQQELATKLGMARGTLCDIEKGRQLVSPALAKKIAKKIGFSEIIAIKASLQDQLIKAKIKLKVDIVA